MNDGTAQIGFQMGQQAMAKGGEYMETHVRFQSLHIHVLSFILHMCFQTAMANQPYTHS